MKLRIGLISLWCLAVVSGWLMIDAHQSVLPPSAQKREKSDVMLDVVGEFRTVLARYLWFKMDLFHEVLDSQEVASEKQVEVIPLLRMVSLLDPSITEAYDNLAWDLYKGHGETEKALVVVTEGLQRNPQSFQLRFRMASILYQEKSYQEALEYAQEAIPLVSDEFEKLNIYRLIYWSSKELKNRTNMRFALAHLLALRPGDPLWLKELAELEGR